LIVLRAIPRPRHRDHTAMTGDQRFRRSKTATTALVQNRLKRTTAAFGI
jgi:hypothetical protein